MKTILLIATLATCLVPALAAEVAPAVSGSFKSQNITMEVKSGMAFRGTSTFDKSDVIVVAITHAEMDNDALAAYVDRRRAGSGAASASRQSSWPRPRCSMRSTPRRGNASARYRSRTRI